MNGTGPPATYEFVRTEDLDCIREAVSNAVTTHRLDRLDRTHMDATFSATRVDKINLIRLGYGTAVKIDGPAPERRFHLVQVPLRGSAAVMSGREEVVSTPDFAAMPDMRQRISMKWASDCEQIGIRVDDDQLTRHLQSLLGRPVLGPIRFEMGLDLRTSRGRGWRAALDLLFGEAERTGGLLEHPLLSSQLECVLLTGLLLAQRHNYSAALHAQQVPAAPRPIRVALERIEEHPERPLTTVTLAADAGVGVRALQQGFHDLVGCSPMTYLREVRLKRVREALAEADPRSGASVTDIALDWGFMHLGRFSVEYRRRFGESPSQTLRR
ncbi:AraC family transcriptional regulator [Mycobacterium sp.]|uniref:AraC family transcriptional regulator n=1 Tax=Mycobacterium sp. TaxID=1785 RepID=UPI002CEF1168|nr:AraC family transcriptional regulator [Mycobacterium sp.]HKP41780.1 AraC family transcriptional regulator [Mycobacterium sp.]